MDHEDRVTHPRSQSRRTLTGVDGGHRQYGLVFPVDAGDEACGGSPGQPGVPQVTHQEKEGQDKVGCRQPGAGRNEVKGVGFGRQPRHRVDRSQGGMGHVFRSSPHLPGLDVVPELIQVESVATAQGFQPGGLGVPESHGFAAEDDFPGGGALQVFAQPCGALGRSHICPQVLVTHQKHQGLGLGRFGNGRAVEHAGVGRVVKPDKRRRHKRLPGDVAQALGQVGFAAPGVEVIGPAQGRHQNVPDAAEHQQRPYVDVPANDVFQNC